MGETENAENDDGVAQTSSSTQEEATRVPTTASHGAPKQLSTIREAATLVLTLTGATFLNVCNKFSFVCTLV